MGSGPHARRASPGQRRTSGASRLAREAVFPWRGTRAKGAPEAQAPTRATVPAAGPSQKGFGARDSRKCMRSVSGALGRLRRARGRGGRALTPSHTALRQVLRPHSEDHPLLLPAR